MKRDSYWDIFKGLAITMVVLGHSFPYTSVTAVLYLFHLPAFFFATGYLYSEKKWTGNASGYIGSRIAPVWTKFLIYGLVFVLINNPLVRAGALTSNIYDKKALLTNYLNYFVFVSDNSMAGALWYIPVWITACGIFAFIFSNIRNRRLCGLLCVLSSALGIILYKKEIWLMYHIQTSFIAVGYMYMGFLLRSFNDKGKDFRKYLCFPGAAAICAVLLVLCSRKLGVFMDLSSGYIDGPLIYLTGALGSVLLLCLSGYVQKLPVLEKALSFAGRHSFDIMAFHFICLKLCDILYTRLSGGSPEALLAFPCGYSEKLWPVYLIVSLTVPSLIGEAIDRAVSYIKKAAA